MDVTGYQKFPCRICGKNDNVETSGACEKCGSPRSQDWEIRKFKDALISVDLNLSEAIESAKTPEECHVFIMAAATKARLTLEIMVAGYGK